MRMIIAAICFVLLATSLHAETYKWVDDRGTIHFSEDLGSVPKKYRKKARQLGGDGESVPVVIDEKKPQGSTPDSKKTGKDGGEPAAAQQKQKATYGGKSEDEWKGEFRQLKAQIQSHQDVLATKKNMLSDTSKMSRGQYLGLQYDIKDLETRLAELNTKLEAHRKAANKAGVPPDIR